MALNHNPFNPELFGIPCPAKVVFTYVSAGAADDDDVATATYYNAAGTVIGVLTFTYVGVTNNISQIERTT